MPTPLGSSPALEHEDHMWIADLVALARPRQWTKNLVCFAALVFGGGLGESGPLLRSFSVFAAFCLTSGAVYVLNDVCDREADRAHPVKRARAVAAGRVGTGAALVESALLFAAGLGVAAALPARARVVVTLFAVLSAGYSFGLKHVAIVDVMLIAVGFVLRVQAGIEAIASPQSTWVLLCMFFVALFLALAKRRSEASALGATSNAPRQRVVLQAYSVPLLDLLLATTATTALVCYSLYAVTVQKSEGFVLTILPVTFGLIRYLTLVLARAGGEDPNELLTTDPPLILAVVAWIALCVAVIYFGFSPFPT